MGTTADKLKYTKDSVADIQAAINEKGVAVDNTVALGEYGDKIRSISGGGSTDWQPQPDWWQIDKILADDTSPTKRFIVLVADLNATITLNPAQLGNVSCTYRTSDGATYSGATTVTHTWDVSQDKPCSLGYKTRYVIVDSPNTNVNCNVKYVDVLWVVGDESAIAVSLAGGAIESVGVNYILECINWKGSSVSNSFLNYAFYDCRSLLSINIPKGLTNIPINSFFNCVSLKKIDILSDVLTIGNGAFRSCYSLKEINIPKGLTRMEDYLLNNANALYSLSIPKSITSIGMNILGTTLSLICLIIEPGWVCPNNINVSYSKWSISGLINFINNLGDNTGNPTVTITLGSTNLAKLTAEQIAIATNKNYTLA